MTELQVLKDKVAEIIHEYHQAKAEVKQANKQIEKLSEENDQLKNKVDQLEAQLKVQTLTQTIGVVPEEQKAVLKQQLDVIIAQIENNIAIL